MRIENEEEVKKIKEIKRQLDDIHENLSYQITHLAETMTNISNLRMNLLMLELACLYTPENKVN